MGQCSAVRAALFLQIVHGVGVIHGILIVPIIFVQLKSDLEYTKTLSDSLVSP